MKTSCTLVTGGAGYIGSHVVRQLGEANEQVVVLDNLSTGFRSAVLHGNLVVGDTGDRKLVGQILDQYNVDTIMHFAAHTIVPESVSDPLKYYGNNTCCSEALLECAARAGVRNFIFSSSAAVYGRALEARPGYAEALCNLGVALRRQGQLDRAVAAYREALDIDPDLIEAWNNLGVALRQQGEMAEAAAVFARVLAIDPRLVEARNNLGEIYEKTNRLGQAEALLAVQGVRQIALLDSVS